MKFIDPFAGESRARFGTSPILALLIGAAGPAVAARSTHPKVDALSQASENVEQLSENASTIDAAAFRKSMSELGALDDEREGDVEGANVQHRPPSRHPRPGHLNGAKAGRRETGRGLAPKNSEMKA